MNKQMSEGINDQTSAASCYLCVLAPSRQHLASIPFPFFLNALQHQPGGGDIFGSRPRSQTGAELNLHSIFIDLHEERTPVE